VTGETAQSAFRTLTEAMVPSLARRNFDSPETVKAFLHGMVSSLLCQSNLAAYCALDLALLDLSSKCWSRSPEQILGTSWHTPPPYSAVIPLLPPDRLEPFLSLVQKHAMRYVKIKVSTHVDPSVFNRALTVLGPDVDLRVDANGAWTEAGALANIQALKAYTVRSVEQPVAKDNLEGFRNVAHQSDIPVMADESVCSLDDARKLLDTRACHAFNIRLSKCGGFSGSLAVAEMATVGGLRCQVGCQVGETGILSAAGRHLAGWLQDLLYVEGSFGTWALQEDITEEDIRFGRGGEALPMEGEGLGIHVCEETLRRYTVVSESVDL
jgi:L-alanine-DL-glutamate epimerase-like enolase superfamily enzyme